MVETHILQHVVMLAATLWWTKHWLMDPIIARWRFLVAGLAGSIMWVYVAYSATRVGATSSGVTTIFGSMALAYIAAFMAFVSVVGVFLGLLLWTEEEGEKTAAELPQSIRTQYGD